jgi:hypothetical protein
VQRLGHGAEIGLDARGQRGGDRQRGGSLRGVELEQFRAGGCGAEYAAMMRSSCSIVRLRNAICVIVPIVWYSPGLGAPMLNSRASYLASSRALLSRSPRHHSTCSAIDLWPQSVMFKTVRFSTYEMKSLDYVYPHNVTQAWDDCTVNGDRLQEHNVCAEQRSGRANSILSNGAAVRRSTYFRFDQMITL